MTPRVGVAAWRQMAHQLAAAVASYAACGDHPPATPEPSCPYCADRALYQAYLDLCAKAGVRLRAGALQAQLDRAERVPLDQLQPRFHQRSLEEQAHPPS